MVSCKSFWYALAFIIAMPLSGMSSLRWAALGTTLVAGYKGHQMMRTEQHFEPTVNNLQILLLSHAPDASLQNASRVSEIIKKVQSGTIAEGDLLKINRAQDPSVHVISKDIAVKPPVSDLFLYSRGNSDQIFTRNIDAMIGSNSIPRLGGGVLEAYKNIKERIINGPCVIFDQPDMRGTLSFGQENEKQCLKVVYEETLRKNPDAKINYVAVCRGGSLGLDFATENPKNLKTLTLESPLISFKAATHNIGKTYLMGIPGAGPFMYNFFRYFFPAYKPEADNLLERIDKIPRDLPIFIGHLRSDDVVSDDIIHKVLQRLKDHRHVYLFVINDTTKKLFHGQMNDTHEYAQGVNAFYKAYGCTHDTQCAQEGQAFLEIARRNAQCNPAQWVMIDHK